MKDLRHTENCRPGLRAVVAIAIGLTLVVPIGCGEDEANTAATAAATPIKQKKKKSTEPEAATTEKPKKIEFSYSSIGKRDPFRSYLADVQDLDQALTTRIIEDTERFELDQYRLTGLITATAQPKALVEDPQGKGHVLRLGSRLGKNGGRVTKITNEAIIITEEYRDPTGARIRVPITIKLPRPENDLLKQ